MQTFFAHLNASNFAWLGEGLAFVHADGDFFAADLAVDQTLGAQQFDGVDLEFPAASVNQVDVLGANAQNLTSLADGGVLEQVHGGANR